MSRPMPTEPGWWWRAVGYSREPFTVEVFLHLGALAWSYPGRDVWHPVTDDGCWLVPVASPEEVAELRAEVDRLRSLVATLERASGGGGE